MLGNNILNGINQEVSRVLLIRQKFSLGSVFQQWT